MENFHLDFAVARTYRAFSLSVVPNQDGDVYTSVHNSDNETWHKFLPTDDVCYALGVLLSHHYHFPDLPIHANNRFP